MLLLFTIFRCFKESTNLYSNELILYRNLDEIAAKPNPSKNQCLVKDDLTTLRGRNSHCPYVMAVLAVISPVLQLFRRILDLRPSYILAVYCDTRYTNPTSTIELQLTGLDLTHILLMVDILLGTRNQKQAFIDSSHQLIGLERRP